MNDMKEKIFDLVFDEIESSDEKKIILKAVENDTELKKLYNALKNERSMLKSDVFENASDDLLERNREKLSASISAENKKTNFSEIFNIYGRKFLQYAAVVLLTFYATMYHFGGKTPENNTVSPEISALNKGSIPYKTVAVESGENIYGGIDMSKYKVENLKIDETGGELIINFDVSTNKVIKGPKNDPEIIGMLNYLAEHEESPGLKFKTMKAMDISGDASFKQTLIKVMTSDKDPLIRRKAIKILSDKAKDDDVREALYKVVLSDADQTNRIEALGILEKVDSRYADKAIKSVSSENSEYFKFKSEEFDSNEKKGQ
jgi:hypothetical protein